jgi:CHAT domain-containing protein
VGGVDYDRAAPGDSPPDLIVALNLRAAIAECDSAALANLPALPGTALEVADVRSIWERGPAEGEAIGLEASEATELAFKRLAANREVLHLATHGVVLSDACRDGAPGTRGVGGVAPIAARSEASLESDDREAKSTSTTPAPAPTSTSTSTSVDRALRRPSPWLGRRVLLALANANHAREHAGDENEGLLTADEIMTLDLRGVDWVVLSACQSAAGEAWTHEGVLGMQRAFRMAGARTVIASEWSIDDDATREWMRALYSARARGHTRAGDAIAAASRDVLAERRRSGRSTHPFYWAAFTSSGE